MIYIDLDELIKNRNKQGKRTNMLKLSKDTGISRNNLYNLKRGNAKGIEFPTLNTFVQYFGVPINKILKYSNENVMIDLYDYKHFFNDDDIQNFYDNRYEHTLSAITSAYKSDYVNKNIEKMKQSAKDNADEVVTNPIKKALYIKYTFKDKTFTIATLPDIIEHKNTINPVISEGLVMPQSFVKKDESIIDKGTKFFKKNDYFNENIIKYMSYRQQLFLLCRTIQFSNVLKDKTQTNIPRNIDEPTNNNHENGIDNRKNVVKVVNNYKRTMKHYPDKQIFLLDLYKKDSHRTYRMTKKQILNYQQPSQTDFNNNFYNFIIRDHTKE